MSSEQLTPHRHCIQCGKKFFKQTNTSWKSWREKCRFCSRECANTSRRGVPFSSEEKAKRKGQVPWNKGTKGVCVAWNKGKTYEQVKDEKNGLWKGDKATLIAKHTWVVRRLGRPRKCEHCGTTEDRMYHWANVSGDYLRETSDYIRLCVPCHKRMDIQRIYSEGRRIKKRTCKIRKKK